MKRDPAGAGSASRSRRKLLIASIGVATVSYALLTACEKAPAGNLAQPPQPSVGNPPEPPSTTGDAGSGSPGASSAKPPSK